MRRAARPTRTAGPRDAAELLADQVEEALAEAVPVDATPAAVVGLVLASLPVLLVLLMVLSALL